ncbi:NINE protein [Rhodococcus sovatensis]|uniref:NINE protein n=1 Tax=Rhodococcus sovatensis TaxID=1805840 RepID=UPI003BB0F505
MSESDKNLGESGKDERSESAGGSDAPQLPPEFGSAFDYDATAEASLSEPPATSEIGPVTGATGSGSGSGPGWNVHSGVGNGPGWGESPSYPPPATPETSTTPQPSINFDKSVSNDPYGQSSNQTGTPAPGYGAGPVYGPPDPNYSQSGQYDQQSQGQQFEGSQHQGYPPPPGYDGAPQGPGSQSYGPQGYGPQGSGPQGSGFQGYGPPAGYAGQAPYSSGPYGVDPTAPFGRHPVTGEPLSEKSKVTAGLLGILLGPFGAGRFYLNQPGIAVAQIAVTWLTCGIGGIWPLVDGIMMLTGSVRDEHGRPLRD